MGRNTNEWAFLKNLKCPLCPKSGGTNMLGSMPSKEILAGQRNKEMDDKTNSYYL
jgi:hypothetical protein